MYLSLSIYIYHTLVAGIFSSDNDKNKDIIDKEGGLGYRLLFEQKFITLSNFLIQLVLVTKEILCFPLF